MHVHYGLLPVIINTLYNIKQSRVFIYSITVILQIKGFGRESDDMASFPKSCCWVLYIDLSLSYLDIFCPIYAVVAVFVTRGQFWPSGIVIGCICGSVCQCVFVCVCQSQACPHDNSSLIQAKITRDAKHLGLGPYCFGGWSTLTFKVKFNLKVKVYLILSFSAP